MKQAFEYRLTVPLQDIDAAGVVFFAHLFRYAHEAYEHFMRELGFPLERIIAEARYHLPLVHAEADYRQAITHGEELVIQVQLAELSEKRFKLRYRCLDTAGRPRAELHTVHVATAVGGAGAIALPTELQQALQAYRGLD